MIINDLSVMEDIVSKRSDLEWDGWDIIQYFRDEDAFTSKKGAFHNGEWYNTRRISPTSQGWKIPQTWVK
jgi:hypothetical protein